MAPAHSGRQEGGTVATSVLIEPAIVTATEPYVGPTARIEEFLRTAGRETPFLVVDLDVVASRYVQLVDSLPGVDVFFAVKANPAPEILELLVGLGANFDVASIGEIDACLAAGADPTRLSFGNTVKKRTTIRDTYRRGVRIFAFDSEEELDKLIDLAPGATVFCRILCDGSGADWPLSRKFGCDPELALSLLLHTAAHAGLDVGMSFHVGSQQRDPWAWDRVLALVADQFAAFRAEGVEPAVVNIGGGFPGHYVGDVPATVSYGAAITESIARRLGPDVPQRHRRARPLPRRRRGPDPDRGRDRGAEVALRRATLGLPRHRAVRRSRGDAGRGDPLPDPHAARRRTRRAGRARGTDVRQRRCPVRTGRLSPSARARRG